jgi:hypothetical protein
MRRLLLALAIASTLWIAACSNGGGTTMLPPPQGKYSTGSLSGTYVFTTNGEVFNGANAMPLARTGAFTADGMGNITGGVEDVNSVGAFSGPFAISSTGSSYTVGADGRGTLTLNITANGTTNTLQFGITLTSTSGGLMIDETSPSATSTQASTGSGNFLKQTSGPFTVASVAGAYVFDFSGLDGTGNPDSIVGAFTANNGTINPGVQDENDNGNLPPTPTPISFVGSLAADPLNLATLSTFGRGIAVLNGIDYVFYIVDGTRVRFLSTNGGTMLAGDGVLQDNTIPTNVSSLNSGFVFLVGGTSGTGGITRIGRFTANGATVTNVLVDTNNAGIFTQTNSGANTSISLDAANPGRGIVTFKDPNLGVPFTFVFYLSSATTGVIQDVSQSAANGATDIADGSISAQSGSPFSGTNITGTYAYNWSGLSIQQGGSFPTQDEEDLVGQATISSLALKGAADIFQFTNGAPQPDNAVSGTITIGGSGAGDDGKRSTMVFTLTKNGQSTTVNLVVYFVNPQLALFTNTSTSKTRIVAGILKFQQ